MQKKYPDHWRASSFPKSKPDKKCAMWCFLCVSSFPVGPPIMSHTVWDDVPNGWPGARNTKKPSSLVVCARAGGAIGLVYIEIKAEKWETAVYNLGGLLSVFPSTPREKQSQGVMKNAACNWTCKCETELCPALIYNSKCRHYRFTPMDFL